MAVIQLEVDETLIQAVGTQEVKSFMERQLSMLKLRHLGKKIAEKIQQSGVDHQQEVEDSRQEAWREYKEKHLKDFQ